MRYIIYGAGAVGGAVGARLFKAGFDVLLVARGAQLAAIQRDGLRLVTPAESFTLALPAVGGPAEIAFREDDVVLLTVKSQDTAAALDDLRLVAGDGPPVVCCQNGVENERAALRRFARVYGMLVLMPATFIEPGVVEVDAGPRHGIFDLGRYPDGVDDLSAAIAADFEAAGFACRAVAAIMPWKYTKLRVNIANAVEAVCGSRGEARDLSERLRAELDACFAAAAVNPISVADFNIRDAARFDPDPERRRGQRRPSGGGSTWQSLARGAGSVEADYLNGEVALLGRLHGIPTPVNELFQLLAHRLGRSGSEPGSVPVAEVSRLLAEREAAPDLEGLRSAEALTRPAIIAPLDSGGPS